MMPYANLELSLRHWSDDDYALEVRFRIDAIGMESHLITGSPPRIRIDLAALLEQSLVPIAYGTRLTQMVFADERVSLALDKARTQAEQANLPLRLRLRLDANDEALHALRWETLCDPERGGFLATSERLLLSRYLDSADMTSLVIRPRHDLSALIAVANPDGLVEYNLSSLDSAAEVARARMALADINVRVLARTHGQSATLASITAALRDGPDILYLVAHGTFNDGQPYLWLEDDNGSIDHVEGTTFVEHLEHLIQRPILIVLASCQSAGVSHGESHLVALGPELAAVGVPAVVAMNGDISVATATRWFPIFFHELQRDGQIDRAMAVARTEVRTRPDWWVPVLFLRTPDGRLWRDEPDQTITFDVPPPPPVMQSPDVTGFVGREAELDRFTHRLATDHLAVITGLSGVGKTTLAAVLARRVATPQTIFWHTFREGEGIEILIRELAGFLAVHGRDELWQMLHRTQQGGGQLPVPEVLFDYLSPLLRGQTFVLCFDDAHLVEGDPRLRRLVDRLRVEALTSGSMLVVASRHMETFREAEQVQITGLTKAETERLLIHRGITLSDDLLTTLYDRTEGNAQLLALVINRIRQGDNPESLIPHLTAGDDVERYLLNAVDSGLTEDERAVMQALAVFLDYGGTRPALEALLDGMRVRRPLRMLSDRYLVSSGETPAGREYRQHASVQAFYYAELGTRERLELHRKAADYYEREEHNIVRAAIHAERAGDDRRTIALLAEDTHTLINSGHVQPVQHIVKRLLQSQSNLEPLQRIALNIIGGEVTTFLREREPAQTYYQTAFNLLKMQPDSTESFIQNARVCRGMGEMLVEENPKRALVWLQRGLNELHGKDLYEEVRLHHRIGSVQIAIGDYDAAQEALEYTLHLAPLEATEVLRADIVFNLGVIHCSRGDLVHGQEQFLQALSIYQQLKNRWAEAGIRKNLGQIKEIIGDWSGADTEYCEAINLIEGMGAIVRQVEIRLALSILKTNQGEYEVAREQLTSCTARAREHHLHESLVYILSSLADLYIRQEKFALAEATLREAETLALDLGIKSQQPEIYRNRALIRLHRGETSAAQDDVEQALVVAREIEDPLAEGVCLRVRGQVLLATGQHTEALASFEQSLKLLGDDPYETARTQIQWGLALLDKNETERGTALLEEAHAIFARLGAKRDLADVESLLNAPDDTV